MSHTHNHTLMHAHTFAKRTTVDKINFEHTHTQTHTKTTLETLSAASASQCVHVCVRCPVVVPALSSGEFMGRSQTTHTKTERV